MIGKAVQHGLELYHTIELIQFATGESPPHYIEEVQNRLVRSIVTQIGDDPNLLNRRYMLRNGKVMPLA